MAAIIIHKARRELILREESGKEMSFAIALGARPLGHKEREGDGKTPEGVYAICTRNPRSKYHLSLGINYPNAADAQAARRAGWIDDAQFRAIRSAQENGVRPPWDTPLGGFIMIHGGGAQSDWTRGCIALSDADMDIIWAAARLNDAVVIRP